MITRAIPGRFRMSDVPRRVSDAAQKSLCCTFPNSSCRAERKGADLEIIAEGNDIPLKGVIAIFSGEHYVAEIEDNQLCVYLLGGEDGMPGASVSGVLGEDGGDDRHGRTGDENMRALREMNAVNARAFGRSPDQASRVVLHPDSRGTLSGINAANAMAWGRRA